MWGRQAAMHFHSVVVHLDFPAVLVHAGDQPLRAGHGEVVGNGRVMRDDIHVRLHVDVRGHCLADALGAAGDRGFTVDFADPHDDRVGKIHGGRGLDVLGIECPRKPQVA